MLASWSYVTSWQHLIQWTFLKQTPTFSWPLWHHTLPVYHLPDWLLLLHLTCWVLSVLLNSDEWNPDPFSFLFTLSPPKVVISILMDLNSISVLLPPKLIYSSSALGFWVLHSSTQLPTGHLHWRYHKSLKYNVFWDRSLDFSSILISSSVFQGDACRK